jgi:chromosome segregation ATPase
VLLQKEAVILEQKAQIAELRAAVRGDQEVLDGLDESFEETTVNARALQRSHRKLESHLEDLTQQLTDLGARRSRSVDDVRRIRQEIARFNDECAALEDSIALAQTMQTAADSNLGRLRETFLTLTSDVRRFEIANQELPQFRSTHDNDQLASRVCEQEAASDELARQHRLDVAAPDDAQREIGHLHTENIDLGLRLDAEATRRPRPPSTGRRMRPSDDARKPSREIKALKADVRALEQRIVSQKERLVAAQTRLNDARANGHNSHAAARAQEAVAASAHDYAAMRQAKRELEDQIDRLREMHGDLGDEMSATERLAGQLRRGLAESRRLPRYMEIER